MMQWLRHHQEARRLVQADAKALFRNHGGEAYGEGRQRERGMLLTLVRGGRAAGAGASRRTTRRSATISA